MSTMRWVGQNDDVVELLANRCCWCTPHHWLTYDDALRHIAGALTSHGMCPKAKAAFDEHMDFDIHWQGD